MNNKIKEQILIFRIRKGDEGAFREIYKIFYDRIYRFVFFRVPNTQIAEDILQESFLITWNDYLKNKEKKIISVQALIYKIARNLINAYYRKNSKAYIVDIEEVEYKLNDQNISLDKEVDIKIDIKKLNQDLDKLSDHYREIIELRYLDQLSLREIAKILNKTENNVGVLLSRALKKIKEITQNEKK